MENDSIITNMKNNMARIGASYGLTLATLIGSRTRIDHPPDADYDVALVIQGDGVEGLHGVHFNLHSSPMIDFIFVSEDAMHSLKTSQYIKYSILRNAQVLWHRCDECYDACHRLTEGAKEILACENAEAENLVWHIWNIVRKLRQCVDKAAFSILYAKFLYFIPNIYSRLSGLPLMNEVEAASHLRDQDNDLYNQYVGLLRLNPFVNELGFIYSHVEAFLQCVINRIGHKELDFYVEVKDLIMPINYCAVSPDQLCLATERAKEIARQIVIGA